MISKISTGLAVLALSLQVAAQNGPWAQCGGNGWTGSTACVSGYTCVFSNEWYSQCIPGSGSPTSTTRTTSALSTSRTGTTTRAITTTQGGGGGGIVTPTKVTTVFPAATGETLLPSATVITGVFDGRMARWHRSSSSVCQGQTDVEW